MDLYDFVDNRVQLGILIKIYLVIVVDTLDFFIRSDNDNLHIVYLAEFIFICLGSTGHAGQFIVHSEIILQSDRRESL